MRADIICWDSSVMISHIRGNESNYANRAQKTRVVVAEIVNGNYKLILSTLLYPEVLASKMPPQAIALFDDFVKNRDIGNIAVGIKIARKAQSIRNLKPTLKTPDAIHIATAIIGNAGVLHTFDSKLLALSKQGAVDGLEITDCEIPGMQLPLIP